MRECRAIEVLFASYVDGEMAVEQRSRVDLHLERCAACRQRVARERTARDTLAAGRMALRCCASETLRMRCAGAARATAVPPARWTRIVRRAWVPLSLAAALVLAIAGVFVFGLTDSVEAIAAQMAVDHVKCFQTGGDGVSIDAADAGRKWAQAHGWAIEVPPSAPSVQLELRDVRRCFTTDGRAAHLMYRWKGQPLSVFVLPEALAPTSDAQTLIETFGQEAVVWSERGRTYVVLTKGPPLDMAPVVRYVRATAR